MKHSGNSQRSAKTENITSVFQGSTLLKGRSDTHTDDTHPDALSSDTAVISLPLTQRFNRA